VSWEEREVAIDCLAKPSGAPDIRRVSADTGLRTVLYGHYNREGYWVEELVSFECISTRFSGVGPDKCIPGKLATGLREAQACGLIFSGVCINPDLLQNLVDMHSNDTSSSTQ